MQALAAYQAQYVVAAKSLGLNGDITVAGNLRRLGTPAGAAWAAQALASLGVAAGVFFAFRRPSYRLSLAALFAGNCLSAPHASAYDSIPLTAAILLLQPKSAILTTLCLVIYLAPYMLLNLPVTGAGCWFLYAFPETLLFLGIIYLAMTTERPSHNGHEPDTPAKPYPNQR